MFELITSLLAKSTDMLDKSKEMQKKEELEDQFFKNDMTTNFISFKPVWLIVIALICVTIGINILPQFDIMWRFVAALPISNLNKVELIWTIGAFSILSLSFSRMWYSVFTRYIIRLTSVRIDGMPRRLAKFAIYSPVLALIVLLIFPGKYFPIAVTVYYLVIAVAMGAALLLSVLIQQVIRNSRNRFIGSNGSELAQVGERLKLNPEELSRVEEFRNIDSLSFGWVGTNLMSLLFLLTFFFVLLLDLIFFDIGFHDYFSVTTSLVEGEFKNALVSNQSRGLFLRQAIVEILFLFTFAIMGFFSGRFRNPIENKIIKAESYLINLLMNNSNLHDLPQDPSENQVKNAEKAGSQNTSSFIVAYGLLESSRALSTISSVMLVAIMSSDLLLAFSFGVFLAFSFLFNDLIDFRSGKDLCCHPDRPLPKGTITTGHSIKMMAIILVLLTIILISFGKNELLLAYYFALLGSIIYSILLKPFFPTLATPFWCIIVTYAFFLNGNFSLELVVGFFLVMFGREILLDLRDIKADAIFIKKPTLPMVFGSKTKYLSILFMSVGAIILINSNSEISLLLICLLAAFSGFILLQTAKKERHLRLFSLLWFLPIVL